MNKKILTYLAVAAAAAGGWYFYRKSKNLPFLPWSAATTAGNAPVSPASPGTSNITGTLTSVGNLLSSLTQDAGALGITVPNDTTNTQSNTGA